MISAPVYRINDGIRTVEPYFHVFKTAAKKRWFNRTVLDIFSNEFGTRDEKYYRKQIEDGVFKIIRNPNRKTNLEFTKHELFDLKLQNGDIVINTMHCHEPVVSTGNELYIAGEDGLSFYSEYSKLYCSFQIIYEDDDLLVLNKPGGVPIHPTGNYFYNSLIEILKYELKVEKLYCTHRLDKLTSGIIIISKNIGKANEISKEFQDKLITKKYYSRVLGNFPESVVCKDPIFRINPNFELLNEITLPVKTAMTKFLKLSYDPILNQSIIQCEPLTGRTHQIRIHLRNLGFPIVNDPTYGPRTNLNIKNDIELRLLNELKSTYSEEQLYNQQFIDENVKIIYKMNDFSRIHSQFKQNIASYKSKDGQKCPECDELLMKSRNVEDLFIYLHAFNYTLPAYSFQSNLPKWATMLNGIKK